MQIIDLTHPISPDISIFPGDEAPIITDTATIANCGYQTKQLTLSSHTGTHIDAPAHLISGAKTLDQFPAHHFVGRALVLNCLDIAGEISLSHLERHIAGQKAEFILLLTGWDRHWQTEAYCHNFPVLSIEAAKWLAALELKGVGIDCLSIDHPDSTELANHHRFLEKEIVIIENLTNLACMPSTISQLYCLPLLISASDAAPARVIAVTPACA
ncbi:MAG: cyclase family protein [Desulfobulbaceae bacterium]|nr:cyclase family protein [Desulfobulbaceae bacterium]